MLANEYFLLKKPFREFFILIRYYRFIYGHLKILKKLIRPRVRGTKNMTKYIVVEDPNSWNALPEHVQVISARDYLTLPEYSKIKKARIFNLCQNYSYQSTGYYVSLLAEARGHTALPTIKNLVDFRDLSIVRLVSEEFDALIQKSLKGLKSRHFTLSIYFGQNVAKKYEELSAVFHRYFQIPLMRVTFKYSNKWVIKTIRPIPVSEVPEQHKSSLQDFTSQYFARKRYPTVKPNTASHDLAILVNPHDPSPPSNAKALKMFAEYAERLNFRVEFVQAKDLSRLSVFDALFIRMGTEVNNESYAFARKAEQEGLALVDYPSAILRCCNKVYMAEALANATIDIPKTMIIHRDNIDQAIANLGLPMVLKSPDSNFSFGVKKAETKEEYLKVIEDILKLSDLVIAQEYMPSEYDWRIGVLDNQPLFACRYYMAKGHWQIYNWSAHHKEEQDGWVDAVAIEDVPEYIMKPALKTAKLMGEGLYGVDLKEVKGKAVVIEINDNPNIDFGVEDGYYGGKIYQKIIRAFKERIDRII